MEMLTSKCVWGREELGMVNYNACSFFIFLYGEATHSLQHRCVAAERVCLGKQ